MSYTCWVRPSTRRLTNEGRLLPVLHPTELERSEQRLPAHPSVPLRSPCSRALRSAPAANPRPSLALPAPWSTPLDPHEGYPEVDIQSTGEMTPCHNGPDEYTGEEIVSQAKTSEIGIEYTKKTLTISKLALPLLITAYFAESKSMRLNFYNNSIRMWKTRRKYSRPETDGLFADRNVS